MPHTLAILPCTARELEAALHAYCDHNGAWDAKVKLGWKKDQPWTVSTPILTLSCAPSVTAANENERETKGEAK